MIAMSTPQNATNHPAPAASVGSPQKPAIVRPPEAATTPSTTTPAPQSSATASAASTSTPATKPSLPSASALLSSAARDGSFTFRTSIGLKNVSSSAGSNAVTASNGSHENGTASSSAANKHTPSLPSTSKAAPAKPAASSTDAKASPSTSTVPRSSQSNSAAASSSGSQAIGSLLGIHDLEAVAQAAMGLDANGNPLPGNEESHRSLAEAVKRLSAMQNSGYARATGNYVQPQPPQQSYAQQQDSQQYGYAHQMEYNPDGTPMKKFQCHLCDRAFARAYNLNTHLATHDPDPHRSKPFPCPYASCKADGARSFSRKHDLQRHVASTHENEAPPDDEEIDENGERVSTLVKLGLGTPGRKFRCDDCGRAFVRRDALKRHQCVPATASTTPPPTAQQPAQTRPIANGSGHSDVATTSATPRTVKAADAASQGSMTPTYSTSIPAGLSLYTSTAPTHTKPPSSSSASGAKSAHSSSSVSAAADANAPPPFYPTGISYESLTREVQDMAMQLVAQATTYNQAHTSQPERVAPQQSAGGPKAAIKTHMLGSSTSSSSSSSSTSSAKHPTS